MLPSTTTARQFTDGCAAPAPAGSNVLRDNWAYVIAVAVAVVLGMVFIVYGGLR